MIQQINQYITANISERRCIHISGVCETIIRLAKIYGIDENKALLAGLLHDITKEQTVKFHLKFLTPEEVELAYAEPLMHGFSAVKFSQEKFGYDDSDVFEAIKYHTIGNQDMSDLAKILFIADFCEPNRNFDEANMIRDKFGIDLDSLFMLVVKYSYEFYESKGIENHDNLKNLYSSMLK